MNRYYHDLTALSDASLQSMVTALNSNLSWARYYGVRWEIDLYEGQKEEILKEMGRRLAVVAQS